MNEERWQSKYGTLTYTCKTNSLNIEDSSGTLQVKGNIKTDHLDVNDENVKNLTVDDITAKNIHLDLPKSSVLFTNDNSIVDGSDNFSYNPNGLGELDLNGKLNVNNIETKSIKLDNPNTSVLFTDDSGNIKGNENLTFDPIGFNGKGLLSVDGKLNVSGPIDPTYLSLQFQGTTPDNIPNQGILWIDNNGNLNKLANNTNIVIDPLPTGIGYGDYLYWNGTDWVVGDMKVSIGNQAGLMWQGTNTVAIGYLAGTQSQGNNSVAIGIASGRITQGNDSVSVGNGAGSLNQGAESVAIGLVAGSNAQKNNCIAIGKSAGQELQASNSIAIGTRCALFNQGSSSIAIGTYAGNSYQKDGAIAIGTSAGEQNQSNNSVAIGNLAGQVNQFANSIILNASGIALNSTATNTFYVNPIREKIDGTTKNSLCYDKLTSEVYYDSAKTFVIPHPINKNKYLVHACLEGPELGVYYRGKGTITNNQFVQINLPNYVDKFSYNFTIHVTQIYDGEIKHFAVSEVLNNTFTVYGKNGSFNWVCYGQRGEIDVEPNINDVEVGGSGPYLWIK